MSYDCQTCGYICLGTDDHHNCISVLQDEVEMREKEMKDLQKAICVYAREELGNMCFETDQEVVDYFLDYSAEND